MSEDRIKEILRANDFLFHNNNIFVAVFRQLGWWIVLILKGICNFAAELYDVAFTFVDFTKFPALVSFINTGKPVLIALASISLLLIGVLFIVKPDIKKPDLVNNILIFILILSSSTFLISHLNSALLDGKYAILGTSSKNIVYESISSNIYDLIDIDQKLGGLDKLNGENAPTADLTEKTIEYLDINEVINYDTSKVSKEGAKILENKLVTYPDGKGGVSYELEDIDNGIGWNSEDDADLFNEFYYRYTVNWAPIYFSLLAQALVFICMAYKVVRLLFEIAFARIWAAVTAANLTSNRKVLTVLTSIKDSYIVLLITCVLIKMFQWLLVFVNHNVSASPMIKAILLLFIAYCIIDAPNLIQRLYGIDAGLSSSVGRIMAVTHLAERVGKSAKDRYDKQKEENEKARAAAQNNGGASSGGSSGGSGRATPFGTGYGSGTTGTSTSGGGSSRSPFGTGSGTPSPFGSGNTSSGSGSSGSGSGGGENASGTPFTSEGNRSSDGNQNAVFRANDTTGGRKDQRSRKTVDPGVVGTVSRTVSRSAAKAATSAAGKTANAKAKAASSAAFAAGSAARTVARSGSKGSPASDISSRRSGSVYKSTSASQEGSGRAAGSTSAPTATQNTVRKEGSVSTDKTELRKDQEVMKPSFGTVSNEDPFETERSPIGGRAGKTYSIQKDESPFEISEE